MGEKGDSGDLRFGAWQSKICRRMGIATASCTIQELIGSDPHVTFIIQRFVVEQCITLQELRITVKTTDEPTLSYQAVLFTGNQ